MRAASCDRPGVPVVICMAIAVCLPSVLRGYNAADVFSLEPASFPLTHRVCYARLRRRPRILKLLTGGKNHQKLGRERDVGASTPGSLNEATQNAESLCEPGS